MTETNGLHTAVMGDDYIRKVGDTNCVDIVHVTP